MHRFFVEPTALSGDQATLSGPQARQIAAVLRLRPGDEVTLVSGGEEVVVALESVSASRVAGRILKRRAASGEPRVPIALGLPLLRGDRSEEVIEAVTQLGGAREWDELLATLRAPVLVAWERETAMKVRYAIPANAASLSLVVGPEGGLTEDEIVRARKRGAVTVSLGARNLRSETAAVAAVALVIEALE